ncbi:MAG: NAD(P)/FAD-dependent oxidoreductase [Myxococcales bacterium]
MSNTGLDMAARGGPSGPGERKRVVIVGGGFAGLNVARELAGSAAEVTLLDRRNHHLFQPLLYQVAAAGLSPDEIAVPLRRALRHADNVRVELAEVQDVDLPSRSLELRGGRTLGYDYLVLAAGARPNYHGHDEWEPRAPALKSLDSALRLRERVLRALEAAELEPSAEARRRLLSFVVIGGGPTGVELAGALAELARLSVPGEYRRVNRSDVRVTLIEMADRVLQGFDPASSRAAQRMLEDLGVEVLLETKVESIEDGIVHHAGGTLPAVSVCWASGVAPVPLSARVDAEHDDGGRLIVDRCCALPEHPEVFVLGDMASFRPGGPDSQPLPALAAVAVQQGRAAGRNIARELRGEPRRSFEYRDRGTLATVGRGRAVADLGDRHMAGPAAWWLWWLVHIYQLVGMRNRVRVFLDWAWQYITPRRRAGARIITGRERMEPPPGPAARGDSDSGQAEPSPRELGRPLSGGHGGVDSGAVERRAGQ